jgi:two-component system sensor histidine kinase ChvG
MASDTDTAKPEPARSRWRLIWPGSRLGRLILALNLLGLAILVSGALVLNELRRGLVQARMDSLTTQGELIANVLGGGATADIDAPVLLRDRASEIIQLLFIPKDQRARLFDTQGALLADSYLIADRVELKPLPAARKPGGWVMRWRLQDKDALNPQSVAAARAALSAEIQAAASGRPVRELRRAQNGQQVVSVSIPVKRVEAVLGVLTLEASDVDATIAAQRKALLPFILVAVGVSLLSSLLLTILIAQPVRRLARAADRVRLSRARAISLPDLARRDDEIGDLTRSLESMTATQSVRMDAIEAFAADVAHEIRNPLTSIRSAVETLDLVEDPASRNRLLAILNQDVQRLDRLITDISNASRLDAELSRDDPRPVDVRKLLFDIAGIYQSKASAGARVSHSGGEGQEPLLVMGREGPLGQVFRNLIDNARSFSPKGGPVRVQLRRDKGKAVVVVEDEGPGIPPDNLETVFQRFYTSRPKGTSFGANSGLGLSIARQIIDAHGGRIWAENRIDETGAVKGARFTIILPEAKT